MASKKFGKGSEEWQMFMDYWTLCQKYWEPEESDEWWDEVVREVDDFCKKYGSTVFARGICLAFVNDLDAKAKAKRKVSE